MYTAWSEDPATKRPIFCATMSRNRFQQLCRFLRFDDKSTRKEREKLAKDAAISDIANLLRVRFMQMYTPGECVTVDEQLVRFFGRCKFKVFMPSKPDKYGLKIWVLAEASTGYCYNFQIYTGKGLEGPEKQQGMRVVLQLSSELGPGHNITTDNFFTSYALAHALLNRPNKMTLVGTMRKNKAEIPAEFTATAGKREFSSIFGFTPELTLVSYVPKLRRNVVLLSSLHHATQIDGPENNHKPHIITFYNQTKIGVDLLDQKVKTYKAQRTTRRWPVAIFMNLLGVAAYNSYVVWRAKHPEWESKSSHRRRLYIIELGKALVLPHIRQRNRINLQRPIQHAIQLVLQEEAEAIEPVETLSQGRCFLCSRKNDRKSRIRCCHCHRFVCGSHSQNTRVCRECQRPAQDEEAMDAE